MGDQLDEYERKIDKKINLLEDGLMEIEMVLQEAL